MAIIYSYPLNDNIKPLDELVGTTEKNINGQLKTVTRNFLLQDLAEFFIVDGGLQKTITLTTDNFTGAATLNQLTGVLNIPRYDIENVTSVTAIAPITSTAGTTPVISTSMSTNKLIGRYSAGNGTFQEITLGNGLSFSGNTLNAAASVTPAALTKVDDTNVTLTLGGTPATSLLQGVSLTLGWTGTLSDSRIASASIWNAKENSANKQNSLAVDGTGTKFPTVDAVNLGITNSNYWTKTGNNIQNNTTGGVVKVQGGTGAYYDDAFQTVQSSGAVGFRAQNGGNFYYQYGYGSYSSANTFGNGSGSVQMSTTSGNAFISNVRVKYLTDLSSSYDDRTLVDKGYVTTALIAKENSLPTVPVNGYVLSSTTAGVRSWIPMTGGGGSGSSVNYYLNGGTSQGTFGGTTYYEFSKTAVIGTGADFNRNSNGYIASFITDVADPSLLLIPAGNWNLEFFFSSSSAGGSPSFYAELYKYDGTTFTLITSGSATPEGITNGTTIDAYFTALAVPETVLTVNDRLAIRVYVNASSKTITLHTQNGHFCEVITTFSAGLTALNGLQAQVQNFATGTTGTDFAINSSGSTHTFNLPDASTTSRGVVTINDQQFSGLKNFTDNIIVNTIKIWRGITNSPFNLAIGFDTLTTSTGNQNTVIGHKALSPINTYASSFNTVLGYEAYSNGAANNNTAIGWQSLFSSAANNNSALGYSSGLLLTTGFQNTFIGAFAGGFTLQKADAQNSIAIGYNAVTTKNNQVVIGNSSVVETILRGTTLVDGGVTNAVDSLIVGGPTKSTQYKLTALNTAPASATAAGTLGDIRITAGFIYVCTATNTWVRTPLATW